MSHIATGIAQRRVVGGAPAKAVLLFMAGCASDDGSGIWTSKKNMAADLEMSKRTVQRAVDALLALGVIHKVGEKPCRNGFTVEYAIDLDVLSALPGTRPFRATTTSRGVTVSPVSHDHPTGDSVTPQGVTLCHPNHTGIIPERDRAGKPGSTPQDVGTPKDAAEFWANIILGRGYVPKNAVSRAMAHDMIARNLVDEEDLRRYGLSG